MAFCPEHPRRDQNPKFVPLSETKSIPPLSYGESALRGTYAVNNPKFERNAEIFPVSSRNIYWENKTRKVKRSILFPKFRCKAVLSVKLCKTR